MYDTLFGADEILLPRLGEVDFGVHVHPHQRAAHLLATAPTSVHLVLSSLLGPLDPSFQALSGRLKFMADAIRSI